MGIGVRPPPLPAQTRVYIERTVSGAGIFSLGADGESSGGEETKGGDASIAVSDLRVCSAQTTTGHRESMGCCHVLLHQGSRCAISSSWESDLYKANTVFQHTEGCCRVSWCWPSSPPQPWMGREVDLPQEELCNAPLTCLTTLDPLPIARTWSSHRTRMPTCCPSCSSWRTR